MKKFSRVVGLSLAFLIVFMIGVSAGESRWAGYELDTSSISMIADVDSLIQELREQAGDNDYLLEQVESLGEQLKHQTELINGRDESIRELQSQVIERDKIIEDLRVIIESQDNDLSEALEFSKKINTALSKLLN